MNTTSFFYAHTDQWRCDPVDSTTLLLSLADKSHFHNIPIGYNVHAECMGQLSSTLQLVADPSGVGRSLASTSEAPSIVARELASGALHVACEDPDNPVNFPCNTFIWRSNLLRSSGKGHGYFLKHLLGAMYGVRGKEVTRNGDKHPEGIAQHDNTPQGKLDLLVTLDFRIFTTCIYSGVVLLTATWYEKDDMNMSDIHPFIHPLSAAVGPAWQSKNDWEVFKGIVKRFSELSVGYLNVEYGVVLTSTTYDSPAELAQPFGVVNWGRGERDPVPGKTIPAVIAIKRNCPSTFRKLTSLDPLVDRLDSGDKDIPWDMKNEVKLLGDLDHRVDDADYTNDRPCIDTAVGTAEIILSLVPETNDTVAIKAR